MKGRMGGPVEQKGRFTEPTNGDWVYVEYSDNIDGPYHRELRTGDRWMRIVRNDNPSEGFLLAASSGVLT